ncbi:MAG: diguanylate cyclase [Amphritea sp.]
MRSWRFSTVILSLVLALLAIASAILLTPVYHGAEKALQLEIRLSYERDQRALSRLMEVTFKNIQQISQGLAQNREVHQGLNTNDSNSISHVIKESLSGIYGQQIDAIVVEDKDGSRVVTTNFSLLNLQLPLEEISKGYSPASIWTSENTQWNSKHFSLLRLSLPVIDERFGEVIGTLHTFVLLNDNYWLINQLQGLFGSQAMSISSGDSLLDAMESQPGQLQALHAAVTYNDGVHTTGNSILRDHYLRIGNSDDYRVRSLLPNSSQLAMQDAYTTNLYYAIALVVMLGVATMLVLRYLITNSLRQVTHYAEQIPQSGSPKSFKGGRFLEFIRVGNAIEKMLLRIRDHDKRLSSIVDNSPDLIFIKDMENRYGLVNKRMAELANHTPEQMIGGLDKDFWSDEQVAQVRQWDQQVLQNLLPVQYEVIIDTDKGPGTFLVSKFPIIDDHDNAYAIGGIATDITREKESEELVWRQANFDSLTGLPNRRMFIDRLEQHVKKSLHSKLISAVLFLNLDHFKEVNDSLGHESGDRLIKDTAGRLQSCGLDFDTAARIGGDEFAIILSELDDVDSVEDIAQRLLALLASPFQLGKESVYITSSIGIAFYPSDATSADTLIQCAGQAMTQAKEQGRNRRNYFTPSIQESVQSKIFMVNELRTALTDNQLSVFYQPIVNLSDNLCIRQKR